MLNKEESITHECEQNVKLIANHLDELAEKDNYYEALCEYFDDCLDIEYRSSGKGEYRSVKICITCGGPNIYVDTQTKSVNLFWGSTKTSWGIKEDTSNKIDDLFEEYYNMTF